MTEAERLNLQRQLESVLDSYRTYYNINRDTPTEPFVAEAVFHMHDEQYFLIKSARISEADTEEFVFFATEDELGPERVEELVNAAWEEGTSRVYPFYGHRDSNVTLVLLAVHVREDAFTAAEKAKKYVSYKFGMHGWSAFRMIVLETSTGRFACNRRGEDLKKLFEHK